MCASVGKHPEINMVDLNLRSPVDDCLFGLESVEEISIYTEPNGRFKDGEGKSDGSCGKRRKKKRVWKVRERERWWTGRRKRKISLHAEKNKDTRGK